MPSLILVAFSTGREAIGRTLLRYEVLILFLDQNPCFMYLASDAPAEKGSHLYHWCMHFRHY